MPLMPLMTYREYMQCYHLRITSKQHKRIREIVGFDNINMEVYSFESEPIDIEQAVQIAEYMVGEIHNDWIMKTFNAHKFKTRPLIPLSIFMMFLICDFKIGAEEQGERPRSSL
jgi:hypothetical protein